MTSDGPKRRAPTKRVKDASRDRSNNRCACRTGECGRPELPPDGKGLVHYQHEPALGLRPINAEGTDWIPPQHDPNFLYAELADCHDRETNKGRYQTGNIGSDRYEIDKMRQHEAPPKPKKKWASRPFQKGVKKPWPKRKK